MPLPNGFTAIKDATGSSPNVSLLGIVVSIKKPWRTKGSDWCLDFEVQDDFTTGLIGGFSNSTISCRLFRSTQDGLPKISGPGDVVILRNFKLNAWGSRVDCVGDSKSRLGVLVFPASKIPVPELSQAYQLGNQQLQHEATYGTREPSTQEQVAVIHLKYAASGLLQQVKQHAAAVSFQPPKSDKSCLIKDLEFSRFYDIRAQVVNMYYTPDGSVDLKVTDYTSNKDLFCYVHPNEADASFMPMNASWKGPYGQLTLNVILWESNAVWARENVVEGDYVFLKNMRTKVSPANKLEGSLHQDRQRPTQVDIRKLTRQSDINDIIKRQEAYDKQQQGKSALELLKDVPQKPPGKAGNKKAEKRKRLREQIEAEQKELEQKAEQWAAARGGVNTNSKACFLSARGLY